MTAAVTYHPRLAAGCDRINARAKAENIATDLRDARDMIRSCSFYGTADLRWACSTLETYGDGGDYIIADQMIHALNLRERQDAHATVRRQFVDHYNPDRPRPRDWGLGIVFTVLVGAGALGWLVGWITQGGWM
jgi:hypothetical protein